MLKKKVAIIGERAESDTSGSVFSTRSNTPENEPICLQDISPVTTKTWQSKLWDKIKGDKDIPKKAWPEALAALQSTEILTDKQLEHIRNISVYSRIKKVNPYVIHHLHTAMKKKEIEVIPFLNTLLIPDLKLENSYLPAVKQLLIDAAYGDLEQDQIIQEQKKKLVDWQGKSFNLKCEKKATKKSIQTRKNLSFYGFSRREEVTADKKETKDFVVTKLAIVRDDMVEEDVDLKQLLEGISDKWVRNSSSGGELIKFKDTHIEHTDPFAKVIDKLKVFMRYIRDAKTPSFIKKLVTGDIYSAYFRRDNRTIMPTRYLLMALYNYKPNLLLMDHYDNVKKGDKDVVGYLQANPYFGKYLAQYLSDGKTEQLEELMDRSDFFNTLKLTEPVKKAYRSRPIGEAVQLYMHQNKRFLKTLLHAEQSIEKLKGYLYEQLHTLRRFPYDVEICSKETLKVLDKKARKITTFLSERIDQSRKQEAKELIKSIANSLDISIEETHDLFPKLKQSPYERLTELGIMIGDKKSGVGRRLSPKSEAELMESTRLLKEQLEESGRVVEIERAKAVLERQQKLEAQETAVLERQQKLEAQAKVEEKQKQLELEQQKREAVEQEMVKLKEQLALLMSKQG